MSKPVAVVTGATNGIGQYTAQALAGLGYHVVVVGRSHERCAQTVTHILTEVPDAEVTSYVGDLSAQAEVRTLAAHLQRTYDRLDVLINNAGAFFAERQLSIDGIEMTWALNHMAPFLLTKHLVDMLRASAPARVITVSSDAHRMGRIDLDDLQGARKYRGWPAYAQSKLANIMFTYELADRLRDADVTVNTLHPGFVASGFGHNNQTLSMRVFAALQRRFAISVAEGAQTSIYLASHPDVATTTGCYFVKCLPVAAAKHAYDVTTRRRLWEASERLVMP